MKFNDLHIFTENRFTVGVEEESGKYYLSIPVSNSLVDYEEYFEIGKDLFERCPANRAELEQLADRCRNRLNDDKLFVRPGREPGFAR